MGAVQETRHYRKSAPTLVRVTASAPRQNILKAMPHDKQPGGEGPVPRTPKGQQQSQPLVAKGVIDSWKAPGHRAWELVDGTPQGNTLLKIESFIEEGVHLCEFRFDDRFQMEEYREAMKEIILCNMLPLMVTHMQVDRQMDRAHAIHIESNGNKEQFTWLLKTFQYAALLYNKKIDEDARRDKKAEDKIVFGKDGILDKSGEKKVICLALD